MKVSMMRFNGDIHIRLTTGEEKTVPLVTLIVWASAAKLEATTGMKHSSGKSVCQKVRKLLNLPPNTTKAKCAAYAAELRNAAQNLPDEAQYAEELQKYAV